MQGFHASHDKLIIVYGDRKKKANHNPAKAVLILYSSRKTPKKTYDKNKNKIGSHINHSWANTSIERKKKKSIRYAMFGTALNRGVYCIYLCSIYVERPGGSLQPNSSTQPDAASR